MISITFGNSFGHMMETRWLPWIFSNFCSSLSSTLYILLYYVCIDAVPIVTGELNYYKQLLEESSQSSQILSVFLVGYRLVNFLLILCSKI